MIINKCICLHSNKTISLYHLWYSDIIFSIQREKELDKKIDDETKRAKGEEKKIENKLDKEITDRIAGDTAEKTRASGVEGGLDSRITALENAKGKGGETSSGGGSGSGGTEYTSLANVGDSYWYGNVNGFFAFAHMTNLSKDGETIDFTLMDFYYAKDTYSPTNNGLKGSILTTSLGYNPENVNKEYGFFENFPYAADGIIHVDVTREAIMNIGWIDSTLFVSNIKNTGFRTDFDSIHEHDADIGTRMHIHYLGVFFGEKKF